MVEFWYKLGDTLAAFWFMLGKRLGGCLGVQIQEMNRILT